MSFRDERLHLHVAKDVMNDPVIQAASREGAHPDGMDPLIQVSVGTWIMTVETIVVMVAQAASFKSSSEVYSTLR
jgi:hypothetical protein